MYSVAFIYEPGEHDAEFVRLNELIDQVARSKDGFLGAESWRSPDGKKSNATYYWATMDALKEFSSHPRHLEAKRQYSRWYTGFTSSYPRCCDLTETARSHTLPRTTGATARNRGFYRLEERIVMAKAYWINTFRSIRDPDKLAEYVKLAGPAMQSYGGRFVARGQPARVFEAGLMQRTVIIEFDSVEQAVAEYESRAYKTALEALGNSAERDLRIIEGTA